MRGDALRVMRAAGIEIVIDASDAHFFELVNLVFGHQAKRTADVHTGFSADLAHGFGDFVDFLYSGTAAAVDDAEAHRTRCLGLPGSFDESFLGHEFVTLDGGFRNGRL